MRIQRVALVVLVPTLAACSGETVAAPPAAPVNWPSLEARPAPDAGANIVSERERALPEAYAAALATQSLAGLGPLLDEDAHFAFTGSDDAHGRKQIVHAHEVLFGAFDDRKMSLSRVWRTAAEQTVEWTMTGTQARDWMGVPASHKPVAIQGMTLLFTKDDGSITDVHVYLDVAVVKAQLGVGPKELLALPLPAPATTATQVFEQAGSDEEKRNVAQVQTVLDALENNKEQDYASAMADDVEIYALERAQPARAKEGSRAYFKAMRKAIGQLDTTIDNVWGVGHFTVVEYFIAGEQLGPIGWVPAQRDKVIRLQVVDVCEIRDAKIARIWRYDNLAQLISLSP